MRILVTTLAARDWIQQTKRQQKTIALVPTMGNLHDGHLVLVNRAKTLADTVGVSIFVNPKQFGPQEDFGSYPRTFTEDCEKLSRLGVDFVFAPSVADMYPSGHAMHTAVTVPDLSDKWCGAGRPGHFTGVATVVLKLFCILEPDVTCFGEKDFQQLMVIRRLIADFVLPIRLVPVSTVREPDGLAMSSRNQYLSGPEREKAPMLYQILQSVAQDIGKGKDFRALERVAAQSLEQSGFRVEYVAICNAQDLVLAEERVPELVILTAAYLGKTRLIDNLRV